jgi:hypothetical protein
MIRFDINKLGCFDEIGHRIAGDRSGQSNRRGVGWELVHVCIDDVSWVAFSGSGISGPSPIGPKPTAGPSASSRAL